MIRVKVCGITRIEDALGAAAAGADALGLVFWAGSRRFFDMETARAICRALPPLVSRVGLFMDAGVGEVVAALSHVGLDWLQLYWRESQNFCQRFSRPWIKTLAMGGSRPDIPDQYLVADALLLDAHAPGQAGGSGRRFDWIQVPALPRPWILAGG